ncbi:efflux RND transporter periplasmic adaptor subunit [Povalibacter sp.]|uniref:efflux RND transporter periplasmic adaptor subunit n=1 Tax=Povalibacter sp. TaxID=1962978 RepID=UPI002F412F89
MISAVPQTDREKVTRIRDTSAQDVQIDQTAILNRRRTVLIGAGVGGLLLLALIVMLVRSWFGAEVSVPLERVRIAEVTRGEFIRDVSAQGTVVAAVSPTLFAVAPGTVHYMVQAGDTVKKQQPIAQIDSPELRNELAREEATLAGMEVAVQRQSIDTRRQLLGNQQTIDLANVSIQAAEREQRRAEDSWGKHLISERDYEKARDDAAAAAVNHKHAVETAQLQKESLQFELSARRLERDRQRLVVQDLQRRVGDLEIRSPVDGIVGTLAVNERAAVPQNAAVITVVDLTAFEIEFTVPETYADDLKLGMDAEVSYSGKTFAAAVSAVSPEVKQGQVTGRLRFSGDVPRGLRQNQRLSTRIVLEQRDGVIKVARGPFLDTSGGRVAFVVRGDIATRASIQTGSTSVSEVEILEGLSPGDRIIISNLGEFDRIETVRLAD